MSVHPLDQPRSFELVGPPHPTRVQIWTGSDLALEDSASHYITVFDGAVDVTYGGGAGVTLRRGHFGTAPGATRLSGQGQALVVSSLGYRGMALFGGPLEEEGRLRYVDNCTNSLLLSPPVRGEPCLNFLKLPRDTKQTPHTHPSIRVGLIFSGVGQCQTADGYLPFAAGTAFIIPPHTLHSFQSDAEELRIVIYHPDSDSGPTHEDHTMLNRTLVDGVSARTLEQLHTRDVP